MSFPFSPLISAEDVRVSLNGLFSGSENNYYFWNIPISSGSVNEQVMIACQYVYGILGDPKMKTTDANILNHIKFCELDYASLRVLTVLSGDIIVEGFDWIAGVTIRQPHLINIYRDLQDRFKSLAELHLRAIQDICVTMEGPSVSYRDTAPGVF